MFCYQVQLFAAARELVDRSEIDVESIEGATAGQLQYSIGQQWPELASLAGRSRLAVNQQYVTEGHRLHPQDEIALIPPVSGG